MNLEDFKNLGVKEVSVINQLVFPSNPHTLMKGISPECQAHNKKYWDFNKAIFEVMLWAPNAKDGVYSIEHFDEVLQGCKYLDGKPIWFDYDKALLKEDVIRTRHILRLKEFAISEEQMIAISQEIEEARGDTWIEFETDTQKNKFFVENQGDYLCIALEDDRSGCQYLTLEQATELQNWFAKQTFKKEE